MTGRFNIINFGYNPWSYFWKRNQTMVYLLAQTDWVDQALFINREVWAANLLLRLSDERREPHIHNWRAIVPRAVEQKITAFTPMHLPFQSRLPMLRKLNDRVIDSILARFTKKPTLCIVNDPLPASRRLIEPIFDRAAMKIFDWSDDFKEFTADPAERDLLERNYEFYCENSDIVLTVNENLCSRAKAYRGNAHTIRNATNFFTFREKSLGVSPGASEPPKFKRPVIGYVGWLISSRLDADLIRFIAKSKPEWQFVFMGPKSDPHPLGDDISQLGNVHILDPVPYDRLPEFLLNLDACIIPNKINAYTRGNDPIKIYDYLASGKPIVSTRTQGVEDFRDHIHIADNARDFLTFLERSLSDDSHEKRGSRMAVAQANSWQERIKAVQELLRPFLARTSI